MPRPALNICARGRTATRTATSDVHVAPRLARRLGPGGHIPGPVRDTSGHVRPAVRTVNDHRRWPCGARAPSGLSCGTVPAGGTHQDCSDITQTMPEPELVTCAMFRTVIIKTGISVAQTPNRKMRYADNIRVRNGAFQARRVVTACCPAQADASMLAMGGKPGATRPLIAPRWGRGSHGA